MRICH